jgi:predicted Rossmann-fold nucleotide-binding protein
MESCDAAIALPGGPGTMAEISLMWNRMIVSAIPARPLILVGEGWRQVFLTFYEAQSHYIPERQRELLLFAPDTSCAVELLRDQIQSPNP